MSEDRTRLDHLREMVAGAEERMASATCSDQNFAVLGRLRRDLLVEIEELGGGAQPTPKETGLSDFEKRLRERESGAKGSRRSKSG
jgi:hypothetical protein